ncbi:hypothetical protein [Shouchella miscanthi]|uniref:YtkA-like domain-containing protein n=1 Tax=Shouchella miscanthi TaxID=2598861 RepID=A0ABU6NSI6_9BACI|nr:hypothetical protein [Shouchella miscanthi]
MRAYLFVRISFITSIFVGLTGCSDSSLETPSLEVVRAKIDSPLEIDTHVRTNLSVTLTQGEEIVDDAEDVVFEIWKDQERDEGKLQDGVYIDSGTYTIEHEFLEDVIYLVQSHITARDMHVMPKQMVVVGDVSDETIEAFIENGNKPNDAQESKHHHH